MALKFNKVLEEHNETIIEAITAQQNDLNLYLITNKGNLYYISINLPQSIVSKYDKQFLGNYETVDDDNNIITKSR